MNVEISPYTAMTFIKKRNRAQSLECIFSLRKTEQRKGSLQDCEYLVHKTCSMQTLDASPPPRDKKQHKKINWSSHNPGLKEMPQANGQIRGRRYSLPSMPSNVARTVALLNKRPSNNEMRDINHNSNGVTKRLHTRDSDQSLHRRVSVTDNHLFIRPPSPVDSDEEYFSDDSDSETWRDSVSSVKMNKDDEERLHGISELINTEKNHIRDLKILIRLFKYKLLEKKYINEAESEQLFPALDDLLVSCCKLYTELKEHMEQKIEPHSNHKIGNILVNNFSSETGPGLCIRDAYARLGAKQLIAMKYYRDKCKDKAFKSLMETLESKKVCKRRTYADFLLAVTTRLTKYPPLLKNLFKHTPESHPDYDSLSEAISVIEEALHYIDNSVRQENQRAELQMCKNRFEVKGRCSRELKRFDLTSDKRRLIHRDQVTLHSTKAGSKDAKLQLFLFSDYILLLKDKDNKLILNFDDTQCPAIKVKSCLVKNDCSEKLGFMLISNSGKKPNSSLQESKIRPTLYRFSANTADEKDTWMRLITEATERAEMEEDADQAATNGLSSDERYDDSEESDIDTNVSERDPSVSFDSDSVDMLVSHETSCLTTPDSTRHLALEDIEEQNDDYLQDHTLDYDDDEIERLVSDLKTMNTGGPRIRKHAFNRPLARQTPKSGAAARRAVSLHLAEKQKRVEENRRHTTCLSKEELNQAMNQTLPSNQTLQDNPVRQKSSDSGYAPDDHSNHNNQPNNSHALLSMRDLVLLVWRNDRKKNAEIEDLKRENCELREKVEEQSKSLSRLEEEFKALRAAIMPDPASFSSPQRAPYRSKRTLNTTTYSITEEKSENPQTRV